MGRPLDMNAVKRSFEAAPSMLFIARAFNYPRYRTVKFGEGTATVEVSFKELLQALSISPQQLRHFFVPCEKAALPPHADEYDQLGYMQLEQASFVELAKVLRKRIEVLRHVGSTGEEFPYFTIEADGAVVPSRREMH